MKRRARWLTLPLVAAILGVGLLATPAHAAPSGGLGQYKVIFMSLQCNDTEDITEDEAYIVINGETAWSNNGVNEPNSYPMWVEWKFDPTVWVQLWDDDGNHWYDGNDKLGEGKIVVSTGADPTPSDNTVYLNPTSMFASNNRFHFNSGSWDYYLYFTVTRA